MLCLILAPAFNEKVYHTFPPRRGLAGGRRDGGAGEEALEEPGVAGDEGGIVHQQRVLEVRHLGGLGPVVRAGEEQPAVEDGELVVHDPPPPATQQVHVEPRRLQARDRGVFPPRLAGVGDDPDGDAALAGPHQRVGELAGGEVEDGDVNGAGGSVDLGTERGLDAAVRREVGLELRGRGLRGQRQRTGEEQEERRQAAGGTGQRERRGRASRPQCIAAETPARQEMDTPRGRPAVGASNAGSDR